MFFTILTFDLSAVQQTDLTDEQVIQRITGTNNWSLSEVLYQRYATKVYSKCISFVKEKAIAEDLTHDIFIKAYLNLGSFKGRSKFSTWLYSITYNFCVDHMRKHQKEKLVALDNNSHKIRNMEVDSADDLQHIEIKRLEALLNKVKPEEKMILLLKYQEAMSIKDIQQIFSISESAVKMRIKRAKEKIRSLYQQKYAHLSP